MEYTKEKIVILGAGYAGLLTAVTLQKKLHINRAEITLVNKNDYHYVTTKIHESGAGTLNPDSIIFPIKELIDESRTTFIQDEVVGIDIVHKKVQLKNEEINYDYLVISIGGEPKTFNIKGLEENAFFLFNWEGTLKLRKHIMKQFEQYLSDRDESRLQFVVGGAGFSGMEFIFEMAEHLPEMAKEYNIDPSKVKLVCVEASDTILKGYEKPIVEYANKNINNINCEFRIGTAVAEVKKGEVLFNNGDTIKTQTVIWAGGVKGNPLLKNLGFELFHDGRVKLNEYLEVLSHRDIYVLGDASVSFEKDGTPHSTTAQVALQQGEYVGKHIASKIYKTPIKPFKYIHRGTVMSMGRKDASGVVYGIPIKGRFAAIMKWVIEMRYYFMLGSIPLVIKQIKRQNR